LRSESIFIPTGRAQGHNQHDSLNAEMTGIWTARYCDSSLAEDGFRPAKSYWLPQTMIEMLEVAGFETITRIGQGTHAVGGGMRDLWLKDQPQRLAQFESPPRLTLDDWIEEVRGSRNFYAHVFVRNTHRPWGDVAGLFGLVGDTPPDPEVGEGYPRDASCARRAALQHPDAFAAHRRRGLAEADRTVKRIFEATSNLPDVTYLVYSNHGEVFDHFRYHLPHPDPGDGMIRGTSHGPFPYEVLYANMQMWIIPGRSPRVMQGIGRSIDIAPTILELAGVAGPEMDGESMLVQFDSGRFPDRDRFAEDYGGCVSMVRSDGWKLLSTGIDNDHPRREAPDYHRLAVFDLRSDPEEYVNLADTPQGQDVVRWAVERHQELGRRRVSAGSAV
jgi:hypothetical protein